MTGYFSSFTSSSAISTLSTRFTSIRRALTSDEVDDPEDEDQSHISNVLRAYYTEKGRRFPPWLPPDRKHAATASAPALVTQASLQGYGTGGGSQASTPSPAPSRGGGLSDIWGDSPAGRQPAVSSTSSLRLGRSTNQAPQHGQRGGAAELKPPSAGIRPGSSGGGGRSLLPSFDRTRSANAAMESSPARPLPSQRAGSYQTSQAAANQTRLGPDRSVSSASSAQERLRARLHGGGAGTGGGGGGYRGQR